MGSIFRLIASLNQIVDFLSFAIGQVQQWIKEAKARRRVDQVNKAIDLAERAKTVDEKSEAACELEKILDPSADCSGDARKQ